MNVKNPFADDTPAPKPAAAAPAAAEQLPPQVAFEIERSVVEFERRFGMMSGLAHANGWIRDYRNELIRIAQLARGLK